MPVSMNNVSQVNNTQPINQQPKTTDEKTKSFSTKTAVVVGTGLAALAAVGIYLATKGKGAKAVQQATHNTQEAVQNAANEVKAPNAPSEIETLKEKIATLRQNIKTNYQAERKELNRDSGNIFFREYMGRNPKSEKDYDEVIRHLKEDNEGGYKLDEMNTVIANYRTHLKEKAKALAGNSEFQEIRKLSHKYNRKQSLNTLNGDGFAVKIDLIGDVLNSIANGKTSEYLKALGLSVEDAVQMIKNPKGASKKIVALKDKACGVVGGKKPDDYMARLNLLNYKRKDFSNLELKMEDLFDDMYVEAKNAKLTIATRKERLKQIKECQQNKVQYKQKVIELSHKTRQSAEVQELKQAIARLKELEAKEKNITSANNH